MGVDATLEYLFNNRDVVELVLFVLAIFSIIEWITYVKVILQTFYNVFRNPDETTSRIRIVFVLLFFFAIRAIFVPFYVVSIFVPMGQYQQYIPVFARYASIVLGVWWNLTLVLPCITVWYSRFKYGIGNISRPDTNLLYKFIVILPVYNETLELLIEGIESITLSNYDKRFIELHVSFDSEEMTELYVNLLKHFNLQALPVDTTVITFVNGCVVYIHRFPHGGKRNVQRLTYGYILETPKREFNEQTIIILTDSDNYLYDNALRNLAYTFENHPEKLALAGYMTCMSSNNFFTNPWRQIQDTEYVTGEANRSFELLFGTINCLPGGFTAIRSTSFASIADQYFAVLSNVRITDYHRNYLGEDRYLTHCMHVHFPRYSLGFCPSARCKTDPPSSFMKLVKQRKRWALGALSNDAWMSVDTKISEKYLMMIIFKVLAMAWKFSFFSLSMLGTLAITNMVRNSSISEIFLYSCVAGIPMVFSWIVAILTGIKLGHYKVIFWFPVMHQAMGFVQLCTDWYMVKKFNERSWGGDRFKSIV